MVLYKPGLTESAFLMTISLGGANLEEELANASLRLAAASLRGGAGVCFSWVCLYDRSTSYEPGGGTACKKVNSRTHPSIHS